jgi:hypothetical protein|tara:strand:- start:1195 stop:1398 length:204 start_codon:yes stop_codon:yes gene_type:complete
MTDNVQERMMELCEPIDETIMSLTNHEDALMLACAMLEKVKTILDAQIGVKGRYEIIASANTIKLDS